jgi:cytochrome P450
MLNEARGILGRILKQREQAKAEAARKGEPAPVYNDMLEWIEQESKGLALDPVVLQMTLTFAVIHTTSDLLSQTMMRLGNEPHLIEDLRKEIVQVLTTDGLTKVALANLKLMDSAIKETQRINPPSLSKYHLSI